MDRKTSDKEIPMKTVIVAIACLSVLGLVGTNELKASDDQYVTDTINVCQRAEDSYYDGQLHDRPAEANCADRLDILRNSGQYRVVQGDEMPIITKN